MECEISFRLLRDLLSRSNRQQLVRVEHEGAVALEVPAPAVERAPDLAPEGPTPGRQRRAAVDAGVVEGADVVDVDMQFLYREGDFWTFMVPDNYEQYTAGKSAMGEAAQWLKDGVECQVTLWNGEPLTVQAPAHVELKIVETDPGVRGDTIPSRTAELGPVAGSRGQQGNTSEQDRK